MKNILIKGSGDVIDSQVFFDFVTKTAVENYTVVICGCGTEINTALKKTGYTVKFDKLGRRITNTWKERMVVRYILECKEKRLQDKFVGKGVIIVPPILYAGSVLCPINGDDLVKAYELGFDKVYVFTKEERYKKKKIIFQDFPKITVLTVQKQSD